MRRHLILFVTLLFFATTTAFAQTTRDVSYSSRSVVHVNAKLRFTTMIILPESEEILDFVCGDRDFWIVSGAQNLA
jgi:type IV secretion system protein VirB9